MPPVVRTSARAESGETTSGEEAAPVEATSPKQCGLVEESIAQVAAPKCRERQPRAPEVAPNEGYVVEHGVREVRAVEVHLVEAGAREAESGKLTLLLLREQPLCDGTRPRRHRAQDRRGHRAIRTCKTPAGQLRPALVAGSGHGPSAERGHAGFIRAHHGGDVVGELPGRCVTAEIGRDVLPLGDDESDRGPPPARAAPPTPRPAPRECPRTDCS